MPNNKKYICLPLLCSLLILPLTVPSYGYDLEIGGHGVITAGGDLNSTDFDYGAQVTAELNSHLAIQISGTQFWDSRDNDNGWRHISAIQVSCRLGTRLTPSISIYVAGGINYNITDIDISLLELSASTFDRTAEEHAEANGMTVRQAEDHLEEIGVSGGVDIDDHLGWHGTVGLSWELEENFELFAEYVHTASELNGTLSIRSEDLDFQSDIDDDYQFGMVRIGVNMTL